MVAHPCAATKRETVMHGRGCLSDRSMSVNAALAYENGERPISKWYKCGVLGGSGRDLVAALNLDRYSVAFLKEMFLEPVAWHHTGRRYNVTDLYAQGRLVPSLKSKISLASR